MAVSNMMGVQILCLIPEIHGPFLNDPDVLNKTVKNKIALIRYI